MLVVCDGACCATVASTSTPNLLQKVDQGFSMNEAGWRGTRRSPACPAHGRPASSAYLPNPHHKALNLRPQFRLVLVLLAMLGSVVFLNTSYSSDIMCVVWFRICLGLGSSINYCETLRHSRPCCGFFFVVPHYFSAFAVIKCVETRFSERTGCWSSAPHPVLY